MSNHHDQHSLLDHTPQLLPAAPVAAPVAESSADTKKEEVVQKVVKPANAWSREEWEEEMKRDWEEAMAEGLGKSHSET